MLTFLSQLIGRIGRSSPTTGEIRKESYWLGSRHKGRILEGALLELKGLDMNSRRAEVLKAIILKERAA